MRIFRFPLLIGLRNIGSSGKVFVELLGGLEWRSSKRFSVGGWGGIMNKKE